jgi:hypothetical protein
MIISKSWRPRMVRLLSHRTAAQIDGRHIIMFRMMFAPTPRWLKQVETSGRDAKAAVISDPKQILKGVAGYQGRDGWLDVEVEVHPPDEIPFKGKMKCRLSTALGGMLEPGMQVNVRYDVADRRRILLVDDVNKLLSYRLKA